ncbi:MAG: hypothetical protein R2867_17945 [Caldilineaceae bacterium]
MGYRIIALIILLTTMGLCKPTLALAKATIIHEAYVVPVDEVIYSDCAGEELHFVGEFHVIEQTTIDEHGGFHTTFVGNDHNVRAISLSTGNLYHRVGVTHTSMKLTGDLPYETTYTNSFSFIGQGAATNTLEIDIVRLNIDENGASTITFENRILECK